MNPIRVILNPTSGRGSGARLAPAMEAALARHGLAYDLVRTQARGHAIELASQAANDGAALVVAAGGDGTLNEVVNGLMRARLAGQPTPALGVLCAGRGNDFAGSVGIPADFDRACALLKAGRSRLIDVGRVTAEITPEGRYFINCVGVGFDAVVNIEVGKLPRWGGFLSFLTAVFKTIFLYNRPPLAALEYDGQTLQQRSLMVSIMNGRQLGDGFIMAPDSRQDDGLLDLCIAAQMSSLETIRMVPFFMKGTQATQKKIRTGQAAKVSLTALDGPLPAHMDGEIISQDGRSLSIELLPRQLAVICPEPGQAG